QDDEVIEEIVAVGIRGSLISSMNTKRSAKGVVDAITAEDIGKFPDTNLAESMQRIPGVSIDRQNNEGSRVTVRGFGPEFNLVLLNGRQMPGADLSNESVRSFDFANLASEGVRALNVYKTFNAATPSGGIGSTIDIKTARPFDKLGLVASFGVKAMTDTTNEKGDDFTPELSGIFSNTFADDTVGVGVFISHQERDSRAVKGQVAEQFWRENVDAVAVPATAVVTDNRTEPTNTFFPRSLGLNVDDISRTRTNGQLTLQYAPSDSLTATLDYTYSEFENEVATIGSGIWFNDGDAQEVEIDQNGAYHYVQAGPGDYSAGPASKNSRNENNSVGLNLDWQVTDDLNLTLDAHDSSSDVRGTGRGSNVFIVMGATCLATKTMDARPSQDVPDMFVTWGDCLGSAPGEEPTGSAYDSLFANALSDINKADITQIQLAGDWANASSDDGLTSIQFGVASTDIDYRVRRWDDGQVAAGWYGGNQDVFDDSIFTRVDSSGILSEFSGFNTNAPFYHDVDIEAALTAIEQEYNGGERIEVDYSTTPLEDHAINEETVSAYLQFNVEGEFNDLPITLVGGIRYEDTDITANSLVQETTAITWINADEWSEIKAAEQSFSDVAGDYSLWLPNLDISFDVRDDMIARFSYSKSITRPTLKSMRGTTSTSSRPKPGQRDGNAGNPGLLPFTSDNFDLSFEWYYDEGSYASIGYYRKQVENFIVQSQIPTIVGNLRDPSEGPRAIQARADIADAGGDPTDLQLLHDQININQGIDPTSAACTGSPSGTCTIVQQDDDPLISWRISTPSNLETATLYGWEFAIQHLFGDSGFGVSANATIVEGDINVDNAITGFQFVLTGLSDSANLVGFYENDRWQARIAYNWRDEFLNGTRNDSPHYTEEFGQWDANASYLATDNLTVFVEAINITDESQRIYNRYPNQFTDANQFGARYNIGARYSFE
ncbi:MAG: TonB-dependent receptor, partial [Gammaproteobacteria bacterium]|nr:TonB-dependent receptor [Gammaproteobacteria bacterium]NND47424.1 TonB-dependent receptor [Woeseiaceae bacterium]